MERLDKFLADSGAGTRSQVKGILRSGRVTVDGVVERDGSRKIQQETQVVCVDGRTLGGKRRVVLMLHKPAGYVTATEDAKEQTVMDLLPLEYRHMALRPVGRLDKATEGLLLFTNDGNLLHQLISPRKGVEKVYYARHEGTAGQEDVAAFSHGIILRDGTACLPGRLEITGPGECLVTVQEGKYHQVRRMMASRGLPVVYLKRLREGCITLGDLPLGAVRELHDGEISALLSTEMA